MRPASGRWAKNRKDEKRKNGGAAHEKGEAAR
jgi:hypothetical protein